MNSAVAAENSRICEAKVVRMYRQAFVRHREFREWRGHERGGCIVLRTLMAYQHTDFYFEGIFYMPLFSTVCSSRKTYSSLSNCVMYAFMMILGSEQSD
jgi:hypothetical protein